MRKAEELEARRLQGYTGQIIYYGQWQSEGVDNVLGDIKTIKER